MTQKTSSWFVMIIMVFIIFLGIVGAGVAIKYFGEKVEEKEIEQKEGKDDVVAGTNEYIPVGEDWSVEYPDNWEYREYSKGDMVGFDYKPYAQIGGEYNGLITIKREEKLDLDEIKQMLYAILDNPNEESIYIDGLYGVKIDGVVSSPAMGGGKLGSRMITTMFEIDNQTILSAELTNADNEQDVLVYEKMLHSMKFGGTTQTTDNQISASSTKGNVIVYSPTSGETIKSPSKITGKARVFENVVNYELRDSNNNLIADGFATTTAGDVGEFGEFEINLSFVTNSDSGILEVYTISAKDGSKEDMVRIEVGLNS